MANEADGTVSRIDPSSGTTVKTVRLDNPPRGVALSPQGVYVAVRSTGSEHRGGTLRVLPTFPVDSIDPALSGPGDWPVRAAPRSIPPSPLRFGSMTLRPSRPSGARSASRQGTCS